MQFVVNTQSKECYTLIQKNGTQSLQELTKSKPNQYQLVNVDYLLHNNIEQLTVFIREPIQRVLSGITTQIKLHGISEKSLDLTLNDQENFFVYDSHTIPQFWFLLKLSTVKNFIFNIKTMDSLIKVDPDILILNKNKNFIKITNQKTMERLMHFYTEDIVLYHQFQNSVCSIDKIIETIKLEKNFVEDLQQYRQVLTYLL
jgi:hypothetical protein